MQLKCILHARLMYLWRVLSACACISNTTCKDVGWFMLAHNGYISTFLSMDSRRIELHAYGLHFGICGVFLLIFHPFRIYCICILECMINAFACAFWAHRGCKLYVAFMYLECFMHVGCVMDAF